MTLGHYKVELLHREIPVVITGNGFAVYKDVKDLSVKLPAFSSS